MLALRLTRWSVRRPGAIVALVLFLAAALGVCAARVKNEVGYAAYFGPRHPEVQRLSDFLKEFDGGLHVLLAFSCAEASLCEQVGEAPTLEFLGRVQSEIDALPNVRRTTSVLSAPIVVDALATRTLARRTPDGVYALEPDWPALVKRARSEPFLTNTVISSSGLAAGLVIELQSLESQPLREAVHRILERTPSWEEALGGEIYLAGDPVWTVVSDDELDADSQILTLLMFAVILVVLWLIFRSVLLTLLPVVSVGLLTVCVFGLIGLVGIPMTSILAALPPLLVVIAVTTSIHFLAAFHRRGGDPREASVEAARVVGSGCFWASATTAGGFLSFLWSGLESFRAFGGMAAAGVALGFVMTFTLLPALLVLARTRLEGRAPHQIPTRVLDLAVTSASRKPALVLTLGLGVYLVLAAGLTRIYYKTDFGDQSFVLRSVRFIEANLRKPMTTELVVTLPEGERIYDREVLRLLQRLETWFQHEPSTGYAWSFLDVLEDAYRLDRGQRPASLDELSDAARSLMPIVSTHERTAAFWSEQATVGDEGEIRYRDRARVSIDRTWLDDDEQAPYLERVRAFLADVNLELAHDGQRVDLEGGLVLSDLALSLIRATQRSSFLSAFAVVAATLALLLRRHRGLMAWGVALNVLPVLALLGLMGWLGIGVDPANTMVGAILLVIAVDDTIHVTLYYLQGRHRGVGVHEAMAQSIATVGEAVLVTSLCLGLGFSTLMFSQWGGLASFGLLASLGVALALVADVLILPAAILRRGGRPDSSTTTRDQRRRVRAAILGALVALVFVVAMPAPESLHTPSPLLEPLDDALRVPYSASWLDPPPTSLRPGDQVLEVSAGGVAAQPGDRAALGRLLADQPPGTPLELRVARGGEPERVSASVSWSTPAQRLTRNWPLLAVGTALLLFSVVIVAGSRHPIATPLSLLSLLAGTVMLTEPDAILGADPGLLGLPEARARLSLAAEALLPAAAIHFAMRFPVVGSAFRDTTFPALAYLFWLVVAAFGQVRFHDASLLNGIELLPWGAVAAVLAVHGAVSVLNLRRMRVIERFRSGAFLAGLAAWIALPIAFAFAGAEAPLVRDVAVLGVFFLPLTLGWAIARYRLLEPSTWLARALSRALASVAALLLVLVVFAAADHALALRRDVRWDRLLPVLALVVAGFALLRQRIGKVVRDRLEGPEDRARLARDSLAQLEHARKTEDVLARVYDTVQSHLGAAAVTSLAVPCDDPGELPPLATAGLALWNARDQKRHHAVLVVNDRSDDPDPERPEVAFLLSPESGPARLVVAAARRDDLPYTPAQLGMFETLAQVASLALGSAATTAELERSVRDKTSSIRRSLEEQLRVVTVTRAICEADTPAEVEAQVKGFAAASRTEVRDPDGPDHMHNVEMVRIFGELAVARLALVERLKREVDEQSQELAEIRSRQQNAEFVRNVAHELRKPTGELCCLAEALQEKGQDAELKARIRVASAELSRRLDLLLFHSGLRLDLHRIDAVRIAEEAVARAAALAPDRKYALHRSREHVPLMADPSRLLSLMENLMDNAVKATSAGGMIAVRTDIEGTDAGGPPVAVLEVEDDGCGIPPGELDRVFEPGVSFAKGGFGIGLSFCREIVERHGGAISVRSEPGRTLFRICIPQFPRADEEGRVP
jgi:predicted RND superfamily exporter protein/signal transduction histidine kinase